MCGRYTLIQGEHAADRFGFVDFHETRIQPRFNIAPSQVVLTVIECDGKRLLVPMLWGFRPAWLTPGRIPPQINARAESLVEKPLWRGTLRRNRCLILADGFYEWRTLPGQKTKQPIHIRLAQGDLFAFAGLYAEDADGNPTCAIVTTSAEGHDLMGAIHSRMPVILDADDEALWLDPEVDRPADVLGCLRACPAERMEAFPVSALVSNVRNDGPELVERVDA